MALYAISFVISRDKEEGTEVMPFSQVVTTSFSDPLFAVEFVKEGFQAVNVTLTVGGFWEILL